MRDFLRTVCRFKFPAEKLVPNLNSLLKHGMQPWVSMSAAGLGSSEVLNEDLSLAPPYRAPAPASPPLVEWRETLLWLRAAYCGEIASKCSVNSRQYQLHNSSFGANGYATSKGDPRGRSPLGIHQCTALEFQNLDFKVHEKRQVQIQNHEKIIHVGKLKRDSPRRPTK